MHGVIGQAPDPSVCLDCKFTTAGSMPFGMTVDEFGHMIVADTQHNVVARWWGDRSEVLAGGHGLGSDLDQLHWPNGVTYVPPIGRTPHILYIADMYNHRIMRYMGGNRSGDVVFGTGSPGNNITELRYPVSIYVHPNGSLYVQDFGNSRIMRVTIGSAEGEVLEDKDEHGLSFLSSGAADSFFDGKGNYFSADYSSDSLTACMRKFFCGFTSCQDTDPEAVYSYLNCGCMTTVRCLPGFGELHGELQKATSVQSL